MESQATTPRLQVCHDCGGGAPIDAHFCPQCTKILSLGRHGDYFTFLGLPRRLNIPVADLERRFRALSRQFHPDYFCNATAGEQRASLERSSYLNDAYRTLRHPVARIEYLLDQEGLALKDVGDGSKQVPAAFLEEVFSLNEEIDDIRHLRSKGTPPEAWKGRLDRIRRPIERKRADHEQRLQELSDRWDSLADAAAPAAERRTVLEALREQLLERSYIDNLLAGIERELA